MPMSVRPQNRPRRPARIETLSVLPVFFNLCGQSVIVIGGSDAAAWKAELLHAAGAQVHVFAPSSSLQGGMRAWLSHSIDDQRVVHIDGDWTMQEWPDARLVVADVPPAEAEALVAMARGRGLPVNVIDQPSFCTFQFGSIVNRSPVVVGISTSGAAPILGQAVRQRIEALLPKTLAAWAAFAQTVRARVMHETDQGPARRTFWERLAARAFGASLPSPDSFEHLADRRNGAPDGQVTTIAIGAKGPDDLTLRQLRALQAADVILFDRYIHQGVLEMARREARRIPVPDCPDRSHAELDARAGLISAHAGQGLNIVSLEGAPRRPARHAQSTLHPALVHHVNVNHDMTAARQE